MASNVSHTWESGFSATVSVRRSRGRSMSLSVSDRGVPVLRIPDGVPPSTVKSFLEKHEGFLRGRMSVTGERSSSLSRAVAGEAALGILGWECMVEVRPIPRGTPPSLSIESDNRAVLCARRGSDPVSELRQALGLLCEAAAKNEAAKIAVLIGRAPSSIRSGRWGARWGACDSAGNITLDWRCALLPARLFSHVVAHECCHLVHMDHSASFHRLLSSVRPGARAESRELSSLRDSLPV